MTFEDKRIIDYRLKEIEWENTEKYLEKVFDWVRKLYLFDKISLKDAIDIKLKVIDLLIKLDQWKAQNKWY